MKKLSLILALLLILTSGALCACSEKASDDSDDEKGLTAYEEVAMKAFETAFVDRDFDEYFEVNLECNRDLAREYPEDYELYSDTIRNKQKEYKENIRNFEDFLEEHDGKLISYEIDFSEKFNDNDEEYDDILDGCVYNYEDMVENVAFVRIIAEWEYTDDNSEKSEFKDKFKYFCYKIDGDWYVIED